MKSRNNLPIKDESGLAVNIAVQSDSPLIALFLLGGS
jgi:hypothetical protein